MSTPGTAVITGASAGIGERYAHRLAERGHDLVLVARREGRLQRLAAELSERHGVRVQPLVADVGSDAGIARVAQRLGGDDVTLLVNNAGINGYAPLAEAAPAVLAAVVRVNALAPVLLTHAVLPGMLRRDAGAVVNVASLLAFSGDARHPGLPQRATYAGTKAHLVAFTRVLATEVADSGVRVQVVCPGYTATEFHLTHGADPVDEQAVAARPDESFAMSADDVVVASLAGLDAGEVVCVPALDDAGAVAELAAAEARLRAPARSAKLAARYRREGTGG